MKRVAIVNQRYGFEVNGGSEYYTRLLAEHLSSSYEVTVLTTTAKDYDTWENYYPEGISDIDGVCVRRFPVRKKRNKALFRIVNKLCRELSKIGINIESYWIKSQGPYVPQLIDYIDKNSGQYDVFIFVTYLYYTTAVGMPKIAEKSILVPTAHDEPYIYFNCYKNIFKIPQALVFLTEEEKKFVHHQFDNQTIIHDVIGIGIDLPDEIKKTEIREEKIRQFREKYRIDGDYLVYVGRVDSGKNCEEMFEFFDRYRRKHWSQGLQLVVVGQCMMEVSSYSGVHVLGYVSEEDKYAAIAGAQLLWLPSKFESFSIALLEGMALGISGIVNGNCEVLKGHCEKSNGSVYYTNYEEFEDELELYGTMSQEQRQAMKQNALRYVQKYYQWDDIVQRWKTIIDAL